jgi:hypothetical protein
VNLTESDKEWITSRVSDYVKEYLSNRKNYPIDPESGRLMFYDDGESVFTSRKGWVFSKQRDGGHLMDMWRINSYFKGSQIYVRVENEKTVGGKRNWLLVGETRGEWTTPGLLDGGTSYYDSRVAGTKPMNFYDRYRGVWNFNRFGRAGIGGDKTDAFNTLLQTAISTSLVKTTVEFINSRGLV